MSSRLFKELERSYGFDEVAIVPGQVTVNPELTSSKLSLGGLEFDTPFLASAMDGAVSPAFAALMHRMGGLGVLNGEGLYSRYKDPYEVLESIISTPQEAVTEYLPAGVFRAGERGFAGPPGAGNHRNRRRLRGVVHSPDHQAAVAGGGGGRRRPGGGAEHRHHRPAHLQQLPGPHLFRTAGLAQGAGAGGQLRHL